MEIWLNPACSKCQAATAELDAAGVAYTVRRYLEDPPTAAEPRDHLAEAGIDLPREPGAREAWLAAMAAAPATIQRPIITAADGTTVVGRDPDTLDRVVAAETSPPPSA